MYKIIPKTDIKMYSNPTYLLKKYIYIHSFSVQPYLFPVYLQSKVKKEKKKIQYVILGTKQKLTKCSTLTLSCFSHKMIFMPAFPKLANSIEVKKNPSGFAITLIWLALIPVILLSIFLPKCNIKTVDAMSIYKLLWILCQHLTHFSVWEILRKPSTCQFETFSAALVTDFSKNTQNSESSNDSRIIYSYKAFIRSCFL